MFIFLAWCCLMIVFVFAEATSMNYKRCALRWLTGWPQRRSQTPALCLFLKVRVQQLIYPHCVANPVNKMAAWTHGYFLLKFNKMAAWTHDCFVEIQQNGCLNTWLFCQNSTKWLPEHMIVLLKFNKMAAWTHDCFVEIQQNGCLNTWLFCWNSGFRRLSL